MMTNNKSKRTRAEAAKEKVEGAGGKFARIFSLRGYFVQIAIFVALAAGLYAILIVGQPALGVKVGKPSPRDFVARTSFSYPVLAVESSRFERAANSLLMAIEEGRDARLWRESPPAIVSAEFVELIPALQDNYGELREAFEALGRLLLTEPGGLQAVVRDRFGVSLVLREPGGVREALSASRFVTLSAESAAFRDILREALKDFDLQEKETVLSAFAALLPPTVVRYQEPQQVGGAEGGILPRAVIYKQIQKGELILAKGREASRRHVEELRIEREQYWRSEEGRRWLIQRLAGLAVVLAAILVAGFSYLVRYERRLVESKLQVLAFALLTAVFVGLGRLFVVWGLPMLLVPLPLLIMSLCLLYDQRFGFEMAFVYALLLWLAYPGAEGEFVVFAIGGIAAALLAGQVRKRSTLITAGVLVGCLQCGLVWAWGLLEGSGGGLLHLRFWESELLRDSVAGLGNGVMSGFLLSGLLPAIERLFGVTTDIRLLEWSDPNQPLLQRLLLDAPGTYHHSMIVGGLAADAAEAIGANPLLSRVSAYFHDIGKLNKPEYFVENLPKGAQNPHEDLSPTMSTLVITGHPKDGAEMAKRYGLPRIVREIILQSHGSSVVKYFYGRAKEAEEDKDEAKEDAFRYRLPKPRSKEAAIVMMCDTVESAVRSVESPSPAKIEKLAHELIMDKFHDGQLEESGLTITELSRIEKSLVRGVNAIFHDRVAYPGQEEQEVSEEDAALASGDSEPSRPS